MWNLNMSGNSKQCIGIYSDASSPDDSGSIGAKKFRLHDVTNRNTGRATMEKISAKPESQSEHMITKTVEKAESMDASHEEILRYCREKFMGSFTELDENAQDKMTTFRQSIKWTAQCFQKLVALKTPRPEDSPDYQVAKVKYDLAMDNLRKLVE